MTNELTDDEAARWATWKRAADTVWETVVAEIADETNLSSADFSVLTRVVETSLPLRQQQLADSLGWQRSRLSRQLTRMADRGLIERSTSQHASIINATPAGQALAERARVAHARAVRTALLSCVPQSSATAFWRTMRTLSDGPGRVEQP